MNVIKQGLGFGVLTAIAASSMAYAYQVEVGAGYLNLDRAGPNDSAIVVGGEFHFAPVDTAGLPLAEAGFLRRSSNFSATYETRDKADTDILSGELEFYQGDLFFGAGLETTDQPNSSNENAWNVKVGFLPAAGLLLTVGYGDQDDAVETTAVTLGGKYLMPMISDTALNMEAYVGMVENRSDDWMVLTASADYYFCRALSAGVSIEESDKTGAETEIGVNARMFFQPNFSGMVSYTTQDDNDTIAVGAAFRF